MKLGFRIIAGSFLVFLGVAGVSYMQKRFDSADEKKALEALTAKMPEIADPDLCRAEMKSRVMGDVRVTCGEKSWIVNVLGATISEEAR